MGKPNFSDEFKRDAVAQITERGYPLAEVSRRLGVSQHSLYAWKRQLARQVSGDFVKGVHRHLDVGQIDARAVRLYARLHVVVDHPLYRDNDFHKNSGKFSAEDRSPNGRVGC